MYSLRKRVEDLKKELVQREDEVFRLLFVLGKWYTDVWHRATFTEQDEIILQLMNRSVIKCQVHVYLNRSVIKCQVPVYLNRSVI